MVGNLIPKGDRPHRCNKALNILKILYPQGDAFQWSRLSFHHPLLRLTCVGQKRIAVTHSHQGIEIRIGLLDPVDNRFHQFHRRRLSRQNRLCKFDQTKPQQFIHASLPDGFKHHAKKNTIIENKVLNIRIRRFICSISIFCSVLWQQV